MVKKFASQLFGILDSYQDIQIVQMLHDEQGRLNPVRTITLENVTFEEITHLGLDYSGSIGKGYVEWQLEGHALKYTIEEIE